MIGNKTHASLLIAILLCPTIAGCIGSEKIKKNEPLTELVIVSFYIKSDYENIDENPQSLADYMFEKLNYDVSLYSVDSEEHDWKPSGLEMLTLHLWTAELLGSVGSNMAWMQWPQMRI